MIRIKEPNHNNSFTEPILYNTERYVEGNIAVSCKDYNNRFIIPIMREYINEHLREKKNG